MTRLVAKLMVLVAVMLMPFAMAPAPGAPSHHQTAETMPMRHCPDRAPSRDVKGGIVECTMACSAALPAAELSQKRPLLNASVPADAPPGPVLHGLHPDTATPPPKRA